jgi:hypothetical protein
MNTKVLMGSSALVMGAAGVAGLFMPQEIAAALGISATGALPSLLQIHAALLLAFAMLDWMAKDSLIGGIYNRPVLVGNVTHFAIGAITLLKLVVRNAAPPIIAATVIYVVFAIGFGMLLFSSPVSRPQ